METKEFKVNIPEGYEIDTENSTFECIKFKSITNPTYEDVVRNLFKDNPVYFIHSSGNISRTYEDFLDPNNAVNKRQLEGLLAMNQLLNIAEYYNRKREKTLSGYIISRASDGYLCVAVMRQVNMNTQVPFFYSREDAKSVINNPNFKRLLDLVYL